MIAHGAAVNGMVDAPARAVSAGATLRVAIALVAAGVAVAVVAGPFPDWIQPQPTVPALMVHATVGAMFAAVGLVAWHRRPRNRVGPLMAGVGLTWFAPDLYRIDSAVTFTLASSLAGLHLALLGHLLTVFPEGRSRHRTERAVTGAGYLWALLTGTVGKVFWSSSDHCFTDGCPANLLLVRRDHELDQLVGRVLGVLGFVVAATVLAVVVRHWREATPAGRRALTPVLCVAVPIGLALMAQHVVQALVPWTSDTWLPIGQAALVGLPVAFLFGLLRTHLDRAAVSALLAELDRADPGLRLTDALARALHDPTVSLAYRLPGHDGLVDDEGRPVRVPSDGHGRAVTTLRDRDGVLLAVLAHDASLSDHPELIEAVAAAARLGIANERLRAQLHAQLQDVRASRARLVEATELERRRIERDLHDGAQQYLVTLGATLALARTQADPVAQPCLAASIDRSISLLGHALQDLRTLARGLWPPLLTEAGLGAALRELAVSATVPTTADVDLPARLPPLVESTAYFVVAEAVTNVAKHAGACTAHVAATSRDGTLTVSVTDDGRGGADPDGSGLRGLADRVAVVDGMFRVRSTPGSGTSVEASIPCV